MPTHTGGYRTEFDWEIISANLIRLPLWLTHLFFDRARLFIDVHDTPLNNAYGMGMVVVTVSSVVFLILRRRFKELRGSFILIAFVLSFMVIPVYNGYAPWHITPELCTDSA